MKQVQVRASFSLEHLLKGNENTNGTGDKILCSHKDYTFPMYVDEDYDEYTDFYTVVFSKPLNEVYVDDDYDAETFGKKVSWEQLGDSINKPLSTIDGLEFKGKKLTWYGCYIKLSELKASEIVSIHKVRNDVVEGDQVLETLKSNI